MRIEGVAIGLGVRIDGSALAGPSCLMVAKPPMMDAVVALLEAIAPANHRIKEELAGEAVAFDHRDGTFAIGYLGGGVATETDAVVVEPMDTGEELGVFVGDETGIERLVEIDDVSTVDDLAKLLAAIVACCKDVVVHQDDLAASVGHAVDIPIGTNGTLLLRDHTPWAATRTASGEKAIRQVGRDIGIDGEIGLGIVDMLRKHGMQVVASAPPKNLVCVDGIGIIGREVEDLAQIDAIHVPGQHRLVPLNVVALLLVPGGYLA